MLTGAEIVAILMGLFGMMGAFFVYIRDVKRIQAEKEAQKAKDDLAKDNEDANRQKLLEDVTDATFRRMKSLLDDTKDALKDAEFRLRDAEKRLAENERRVLESEGKIHDLENENDALRRKVEALTSENNRHIETIKILTLRIEESERKSDEK